MKSVVFAVVLQLCSSVCSGQTLSSLADGRSGDIEFNSVTPSGHYSLANGTFDKTPTKIKGRLLMPAVQTGSKVPAVVIQHGSSGVTPNLYSRWAQAMVSAGYAAFVVDSFSPRGVSETGSKQSRLSGAADIADVFSALRLLSTHPSIDSNRIAIVGFSRGGSTALAVPFDNFRKAVLGETDLSYAIAVAHYPGCVYSFVENVPTKTTIRVFVGDHDDFTGTTQCFAYEEFLKRRGYDVDISAYANNHHGYDADIESTNFSRLETYSSCEPLVVNLDEAGLSPIYVKTGVRLSPESDFKTAAAQAAQWQSSCTGRGARIGFNPRADVRQRAVDDTLTALRERFAKP